MALILLQMILFWFARQQSEWGCTEWQFAHYQSVLYCKIIYAAKKYRYAFPRIWVRMDVCVTLRVSDDIADLCKTSRYVKNGTYLIVAVSLLRAADLFFTETSPDSWRIFMLLSTNPYLGHDNKIIASKTQLDSLYFRWPFSVESKFQSCTKACSTVRGWSTENQLSVCSYCYEMKYNIYGTTTTK